MTHHTTSDIFNFAADMCREAYGLKNSTGMSDEDHANAVKAGKRLFAAINELHQAIEDVKFYFPQGLCEADTFRDWVFDHCPSQMFYEEKLEDTRRG